MQIDVLTLFPDFLETFFHTSIIKRGYEKKAFKYNIVNIRDFAINDYGQVDDSPFGGGSGMLIRPEPLFNAIESLEVNNEKRRVIFFSPKGRKITHEYIIDLTKCQNIVLICGHYEGIDQRFIDKYVDEQVSVGDFVVTGGELPAMLLIDAVVRQIEGVIKPSSLEEESFTHGLLECRQYTRPSDFRGHEVPDVLLSGNHKEIERFRKLDAIRETFKYRRDLLEVFEDDQSKSKLINIIKREFNDVSY